MERLLDELAALIAADTVRLAAALGIDTQEAWYRVVSAVNEAMNERLAVLLPQVIEVAERESFAASVSRDIAGL